MGSDSRPATPHASGNQLDQVELDQLLRINGFLEEDAGDGRNSLIDEIKDAILDSGKLSLPEWKALRARLRDIESLIPTIDLIIQLKNSRGGDEERKPASNASDRFKRAGK
jgi:hypothetical protein